MKTIEDFIKEYRSLGRFGFSLDALKAKLPISEKALLQALYRYQKNERISMVRKGFYIILVPEYTRNGTIPLYYYIDDLMHWLGRSYYLSLYTAAALHGASHQQIMDSYVTIQKPPVRDIINEKLKLHFIVSDQWDNRLIEKKKTDSGYVMVSGAALTALDLISHHKHAGIIQSAEILAELTDSIDQQSISLAALSYKNTSAIQRLGFFLDLQNESSLAGSLHDVFKKRKSHYIPLSPHQQRKGLYNRKWKVIDNVKMELEI